MQVLQPCSEGDAMRNVLCGAVATGGGAVQAVSALSSQPCGMAGHTHA